MSKYKLSSDAKSDLIRIHQYGISRFGIEQADSYIDNFFEYFEIIANSPYSFQVVENLTGDYRRCVCGADSIYYKINDDFVNILAIVGRQDINTIFKN